MSTIGAALDRVRPRLKDAKLIAVSKTQGVEKIREALEAGQRVFGENRVQEAREKFPVLRQDYPDIELHLIGPLQTNKVRDAVELFDVIETLDRPALAEALAKAMRKTGKHPRIYVEVNIGLEPQKTGVMPDELASFLTLCHTAYELEVSGLMCIPPARENSKPYFRRMRELATSFNLPHLSMGMSADFEDALAYGATEVRLGTALFNARPQISS